MITHSTSSTSDFDPNEEYQNVVNPANEEDKTCAPTLKFEDGSCYTLRSLVLIARAFNNDNPDNRIKLNKRFETLEPKKYKRYLVKKLKDRLKDTCSDQKCWSEQDFIDKIDKINREEIEKFTYRPEGPEGKFEWLNTINIDDVMEQYEYKYPNFIFIGCVPRDFDNIPSLGIRDLDFEELMQDGKYKIGAIFNIDKSNQSGSHWVGMYADLKSREIYYFDSVGIRPNVEFRRLMMRIEEFLKSQSKEKITVDYNKEKIQNDTHSCGVFSIFFIVSMLKGAKFKDMNKRNISDKWMHKLRTVYFTK